jgi:trimeric autotransporter adhesin
MKKILTLALALGCGVAMAQKSENVGIGTTKPDPSALLDLNSTNKGLLIPRMSQTQRDAIQTPAVGLMIFQTDQTPGLYTFDGTTWQPSNARTAATAVAGAWDKQGNAIDGTDFLGSTNNFPLVFKANNKRVGFIPDGNVMFLGSDAGLNATGAENFGLGPTSIQVNTGGFNTAIGFGALRNNVSGTNNVSIGRQSMKDPVSGNDNIVIGSMAMVASSNASNNIAIGSDALAFNSNGSNPGGNNVAIGFNAGKFSYGGVGNLFLGYQAGLNANESNRLYISNSSTSNPLIKGDFSSNWLRVNSKTTGYMVIGDFDTAPSGTPGTGGIPLPANIGQANGYRLVVQDGILTEKLKVALRSTGGDWADYVFEPTYKLMPLEEVEKYAKENKHLPNVPSAAEMVQDGLDISKTSKMFMEKIEELTLHIIDLNKRIRELEQNK